MKEAECWRERHVEWLRIDPQRNTNMYLSVQLVICDEMLHYQRLTMWFVLLNQLLSLYTQHSSFHSSILGFIARYCSTSLFTWRPISNEVRLLQGFALNNSHSTNNHNANTNNHHFAWLIKMWPLNESASSLMVFRHVVHSELSTGLLKEGFQHFQLSFL